ncbi:sulfur carrier protein ThiS [Aneurinibacillus sp. Ricciae_BoGa-3]|nr:sulfur carrier protein ThiS [Aneurinibacillus sp. Ricciae_BoGa-3]WCK56729.1 sulfur carrier protein ThiS [Aneurinibacillus sp. Ricciae_BoGa-3]
MNLTINGESVKIEESVQSVQDLLGFFGLGDQVVIVEKNGSILEKSSHATVQLSDGDRIEIVHFVGGG